MEQGKRISEAQTELKPEDYQDVLATARLSPRDAKILSVIGRRLSSIAEDNPKLQLPIRIRTLSILSELASETLAMAVEESKIHPGMTESEAQAFRRSPSPALSSVIKPTDNWNFSKLRWPRIDGEDGRGYIPGDIYANCLWYYALDGDLIVDPMAGSGMLMRVWDERDAWVGDQQPKFNIVMSDLAPRGPYQSQVAWCDLLEGFPADSADYIIIDPPYCGLVNGQYSEIPTDLANMDLEEWTTAMEHIAHRLRSVQRKGGRCTVIVPNKRTINTREITLFPEIVRQLFYQAGYSLYDVAYASRRSQQRQSRKMAILNNMSKRAKMPLSEVSEILTFNIQ